MLEKQFNSLSHQEIEIKTTLKFHLIRGNNLTIIGEINGNKCWCGWVGMRTT